MATIASVDKLRLKFPGETGLLFKDLSLSIREGEKVLLLGPSGCGKSTLLQVLTGLIPQAIDVPLKYDSIQIPSSWGYVFQDPDSQFCMPYVDEEIAFVLENQQIPRQEMERKILYYLDQVNLSLKEIHTQIQHLSQGMKQRLAIASVMALEPDLLFLDEPTALLDPQGTEEVWDTIKNIGQEKTVVIVEHKIDLISDFVDRVVLFNHQGEIIADGQSGQIFQKYRSLLLDYGIWYPGVWQDYLQTPAYQQIIKHRLHSSWPTDAPQPILQLNHFSGFRAKQKRIEVEQLTVGRGEWITIIGDNGAGKSTFLLALMQLLKWDGEYSVLGKDVKEWKDVAAHLGFVFQNPEFQFVTNSVFDELAYSLHIEERATSEIETKVNQLLSLFQLISKQANHPYQLSMGQKRRLSVASSLIREQKILLLDEPTFGQDAKNTFSLLEVMEECRQQGTTIIMVTHDVQIVQHFATRIWKIRQGKLEQDLSPDQFLRSEQEEGRSMIMEGAVWT